MIQYDTQPSASASVGQSVGQVVRDIVSLTELQIELFKTDAQESAARLMRPLIILSVGFLLALAALPVGLIAIAVGLIALGLPAVAAYALVALASLIAALAVAAWARHRLHEMPAAFARSQEELARNLTWIKDAVTDLTAKTHHRHDGYGRG